MANHVSLTMYILYCDSILWAGREMNPSSINGISLFWWRHGADDGQRSMGEIASDLFQQRQFAGRNGKEEFVIFTVSDSLAG